MVREFAASQLAQAFAFLDGSSVTGSTPAATLSTATPPDPSLLASTPDANTTDPYIQEEAAELDYDPQNIFHHALSVRA